MPLSAPFYFSLAMNSLQFFAGRGLPNGINYARFSARVPITLATPFDLALTSRDTLAFLGRQQNTQIKDITTYIYVPTCIPDGETVPAFAQAPCVGLYSECTFKVLFNAGAIYVSSVFTHNSDQSRSAQLLAKFENSINSLSVQATIDQIDPSYVQAGFTLELACVLELYTFAPGEIS